MLTQGHGAGRAKGGVECVDEGASIEALGHRRGVQL
jgi:hypothetical protein